MGLFKLGFSLFRVGSGCEIWGQAGLKSFRGVLLLISLWMFVGYLGLVMSISVWFVVLLFLARVR